MQNGSRSNESDGEPIGRNSAHRRLAAIHAVTQVLVQARSLDEAAPRLLADLCTSLDFAVGEIWLPDKEQRHLLCRWQHTTPGLSRAEACRQMSLQMRFAPGQGLPGRVWTTRQPAWIADFAADPGFLRREAARDLDLRSAFAFPILSLDGCGGVFVFFFCNQVRPDMPLLELVTVIGRHLPPGMAGFLGFSAPLAADAALGSDWIEDAGWIYPNTPGRARMYWTWQESFGRRTRWRRVTPPENPRRHDS